MLNNFSSIISVIVPIYNSEFFLDKCIKSILSQSYENFELILVNDGSSDSSADICEYYARMDNRIRVFHKRNGGLSSARNFGLDHANGRYVTFCDSDDWINPDFLERLIPSNDEQLKCCSFVGESWKTILLRETSTISDYIKYNSNIYAFGVACCKLFDVTILNRENIRFREDIHVGEDILFVLDYLCCRLSSVSSISYQGYNYEPNENSLSHKVVPIDESFKIVDIIYNRIQKIQKMYNIDCTNMRNEYLCSQLYNIIRAIRLSKNSIFWKLKILFKIVNNPFLSILFKDKDYWNTRHFNSKAKSAFIQISLKVIRIYYKFNNSDL